MPIVGSTGEKPQSKVWSHDNHWWTVLTSTGGTWLWRLDALAWTPVLNLTTATTKFKADVKPVGDGSVVQVLLEHGASSKLASLEYVPGTPGTYQLWSARPALANLPLSTDTGTATLDIDSTGRLWVVSDTLTDVVARYSDAPYASFSDPISLASNITTDDIAAVTALPNQSIGVFWSNQNTQRFGFKVHADGGDAAVWSADEVPASQYAQNLGMGMADNHLHTAVASDGTLYAAIKTNYHAAGQIDLGLLVRRPSGTWDAPYAVDDAGTKPVVLLSEDQQSLIVAYRDTDSSGPIMYRKSLVSAISFGQEAILVPGVGVSDVSSTKQYFGSELVAIAYTPGVAPTPNILSGVVWHIPTGEQNQAPVVGAGADPSIVWPDAAELRGTVTDDGLPGPALQTLWSLAGIAASPTIGPERDESGTFPKSGVISVFADRETDPVALAGDVPDDPAIWIHPTQRDQSLIIGTDKVAGGLHVYGLDGRELAFIKEGTQNNVDVRYGFLLDGQKVDLVSSTNTTANTIDIFRVDAQQRTLIKVGAVPVAVPVSGYAMYHNPISDKFYGFVSSQSGVVEQWELFDKGGGEVGGTKVRELKLDSRVEGIVADDELAALYVSEEDVGIWKYDADPGAGTQAALVDQTGPGGHLTPHVEGLAIYRGQGGKGYLIASSQGSSDFPVYRREGGNEYLATMAIDSGIVDGVQNTDGLEVTSAPLGGVYPQGLLVVHDGFQTDANRNFKLVSWAEVASKLGLAIDTAVDPRALPAEGKATFADASALSTRVSFSLPGTYVLRLGANDGALHSSDQVTVTVDYPSAATTSSFQDGVAPNAAYAGTSDARITSLYPTANYGSTGVLRADGGTQACGSLLKWELSSIPPDSHVTSVTLTVNVTNPSSDAYGIYAVKRDWKEMETTWTDASAGNSWEVPGAAGGSDRGAALLGTITAPSLGLATVKWNAAGVALVQSWIADPATNHGIILQEYASASDQLDFSSRNDSVTTVRPKLEVTIRKGLPNLAPVVNAGPDQTIALSAVANLAGTVSDDGQPNPPSAVKTTWKTISAAVIALERPETGTFPASSTIQVLAAAETSPVPNSGTVLADPAVWVHPSQRDQSLIIGTDQNAGGLRVYDLEGREIAFIKDGKHLYADVRYNFLLGGQKVDLLSSPNTTTKYIDVYKIDATQRTLVKVGSIKPGITPYGYGMYHHPATDKFYGFVTDTSGRVEQWELLDTGGGVVGGTRVRQFDVGGSTVGVVADDELGAVYFSEESVGIWRYGADPGAGTQRTQVDKTATGGHLKSKVRGLSMYTSPEGKGYLLASSQGNSTFTVYRREADNPYLATLAIADGAVDAVTSTLGIDVVNVSLGSLYPQGLMVIQDAQNPGAYQNFKLVAWEEIAGKVGLAIDTRVDVRTGQVAEPCGAAVFGDRSATATTASFSLPGTYVLRLQASDGLLSSGDDVVITVTGPSAPAGPPAAGALSLPPEDTSSSVAGPAARRVASDKHRLLADKAPRHDAALGSLLAADDYWAKLAGLELQIPHKTKKPQAAGAVPSEVFREFAR